MTVLDVSVKMDMVEISVTNIQIAMQVSVCSICQDGCTSCVHIVHIMCTHSVHHVYT